MSKMTDKENTKQKIKAIYPHIVVGGDIDKPCYTIHWYDIEQKTMICGFGSYKLELVRKWLEEEFEVVERDIDNLIARQQAEIETLKEAVEIHKGIAKDWKYEAKKLKEMVGE
jgi:DNA polymerase elongation subunit (family B)